MWKLQQVPVVSQDARTFLLTHLYITLMLRGTMYCQNFWMLQLTSCHWMTMTYCNKSKFCNTFRKCCVMLISCDHACVA